MYWDFWEPDVNTAEESRNRSAIALTIAPNTTILDLTAFGFPFEVLLNAIGLDWIGLDYITSVNLRLR
jgi:hypothetical protein